MYIVQMKSLDALGILESRLEHVIILAASFPTELLSSHEHDCETGRRQVSQVKTITVTAYKVKIPIHTK